MNKQTIILTAILKAAKKRKKEIKNDTLISRINTIIKGATSLLLKENIVYKINSDMFSIGISDDNYTISYSYLVNYLSEDEVNNIKNRDLDKAENVLQYPEKDLLPLDMDVSEYVSKLEDYLLSVYNYMIPQNANSAINLAVLNSQQKQANNSSNTKLEADVKQLQKENDELKNKLELLENENEQLKDENTKLKEEIERNQEFFEGEKDKLNMRIKNTENSLRALMTQGVIGGLNSFLFNNNSEIKNISNDKKEEYTNDDFIEEISENDEIVDIENDEDIKNNDDKIIDVKNDEAAKYIPETEIKETEIQTQEFANDVASLNVEEMADVPETVSPDATLPETTPLETALSETSSPNTPPQEPAVDEPKNEIYGKFPYKEDVYEMEKLEFVFTYSKLSLLDNDGNIVDSAEIIAVPLTTKVKYPQLMIWKAQNGVTTTVIGTAQNGNHLVNCDGFDIVLTGVMKGDEYKTYIKLADKGEYKLNVNTKNNGYNGHIYLDVAPYKIHISPVTFKNNEENLADFIYCIEENGQIIRCGDNSEGRVYLEGQKQILAKWNENILYGAVMYES